MSGLEIIGVVIVGIGYAVFAWLFWTEARVESGRRDDDIAERPRR